MTDRGSIPWWDELMDRINYNALVSVTNTLFNVYEGLRSLLVVIECILSIDLQPYPTIHP